MKYSASYRELARLADGTEVEIRAVRPADKPILAAGFERLSPESRRRRFFTPKTGLSDEELRYLTEFDGVGHYAIGAMSIGTQDSNPEGLGVARFARSQRDPETAEVSIVVVDDWQCRGIGTLLLERIVAAAAERGIREIRAVALADNPQIRELIGHQADKVEVAFLEPGIVEFSFPVVAPVQPDVFDALRSAFRLVALGSLIIPIWFGRRTVRHLLALGARREEETAGEETQRPE